MYHSIYTSSTQASRGRKFQIWNAYSLQSGEKAVPIGDRQASCASWQQALDWSIWCHVFRMLNPFSFHLISSHRSFSWKLLIASLCHRSLCHPISSQLISCLLSFFTSSHLISSHLMYSLPFSALLSWSQLFSSLLMSPELFSSLLISSQLISAFQIFTALLNSSQLSAAHVSLEET